MLMVAVSRTVTLTSVPHTSAVTWDLTGHAILIYRLRVFSLVSIYNDPYFQDLQEKRLNSVTYIA